MKGEFTMVGMQLTKLRKELGITQQELAELFGIHVQTIGNWERQKDKSISVRKDGDIVNSYFLAMQLLAKIRAASILDTDRVIPSPFNFYNDVQKGELLFLNSQQPEIGDLLLVYDKENHQKPYYIGRVVKIISDVILKIADDKGNIHRLSDPSRYKVIEMSFHQQHRNLDNTFTSGSDDMMMDEVLDKILPIDD